MESVVMPVDPLPRPLEEALVHATCRRLVLSERRPGATGPVQKVTIRPVALRGETLWQFTLQQADRAVHENLSTREALTRVARLLHDTFLQGALATPETDWSIRAPRGPQGTWKLRSTRQAAEGTTGTPTPAGPLPHNRGKQYLIPEGTPCPFLEEMGVMTDTGQVRRSMYAKFRQVNRFLELVHDVVRELPADRPLRVIDFGCGKSYLTFALHHLLTRIERREVEILGLDLKSDVIATCEEVAGRLGCAGLAFQQGAIAGCAVTGPVDLVVSLHACDTATDDALAQAIVWDARAILAVPCCQHDLGPQITQPALAPILKQGILRERFGALATDALRALVLELEGYSTQVVEFIDLEHTPKNLLLRGVRRPSTPQGLREARARELAECKGLLGLGELHLERRLAALRHSGLLTSEHP